MDKYTKGLFGKHVSICGDIGIYKFLGFEDRVRYLITSNAPLLAYTRAYGYRHTWDIYTYRVRRTAAHRTAHITYTPDIIYYYLPHPPILGTYGDCYII